MSDRSHKPRCVSGPGAPTGEELYERMAPIYDLIYGALLQPGRRRALSRLAPQPGESILEIGVGTGIGALRYPAHCRVVAIDLSESMLERAHVRLKKHRIDFVTLCRMDAARLAFPDESFDAIYAPYVMNVVRDPVGVAREMLRVCRRDGRLVLLNHFDRVSARHSWFNELVGRLATRLSGVNWHLDLPDFLDRSGLVALSVEPVNIPPVSLVVVCRGRVSPSVAMAGRHVPVPRPHYVGPL